MTRKQRMNAILIVCGMSVFFPARIGAFDALEKSDDMFLKELAKEAVKDMEKEEEVKKAKKLEYTNNPQKYVEHLRQKHADIQEKKRKWEAYIANPQEHSSIHEMATKEVCALEDRQQVYSWKLIVIDSSLPAAARKEADAQLQAWRARKPKKAENFAQHAERLQGLAKEIEREAREEKAKRAHYFQNILADPNQPASVKENAEKELHAIKAGSEFENLRQELLSMPMMVWNELLEYHRETGQNAQYSSEDQDAHDC